MAPVTGSAGNELPPRREGSPRRRWLVAVIAVWAVVLAGLGWWSVGHERPSVPEQRNIEQALPELQKAAGVLFAAAGGPGRAVELGALEFSRKCRLTPVRDGALAHREVTVQVRAGEARAALEAVAAALPRSYAADVVVDQKRTRLYFHADAGNFVGIDADEAAAAGAVTLRVSTGCRPSVPGGTLESSDPPPGARPAVLDTVLRDLKASAPTASAPTASAPGVVSVRVITCPAGNVAGTYVVDDVATPPDLVSGLKNLAVGDQQIRADETVRAYRTGNDSVIVVVDDRTLRVSVSTAC
jgi:hypothetical protein